MTLRILVAAAGLLGLAGAAQAVPIDPASPTTAGWLSITYPTSTPDVPLDQGTGDPAAND